MLNEEEKTIIELLINNEIKDILHGGTSLEAGIIKTLRSTLAKLGLKELYDFDSYKEV